MSAYIYAIVPYKSRIKFPSDAEEKYLYFPEIPELYNVSEFAEEDGLVLFSDFLRINTCLRLSAFTENKTGYSYLRAEIYKIAQALGAKEVWYASELATDEMFEPDFNFAKWIVKLKNEYKDYTAELTIDVLKGDEIYSYYHDDFSDIVLENPYDKGK